MRTGDTCARKGFEFLRVEVAEFATGYSSERLRRSASGTSSDSEVGTGEGDERGEELWSVFEWSSGGKNGRSFWNLVS